MQKGKNQISVQMDYSYPEIPTEIFLFTLTTANTFGGICMNLTLVVVAGLLTLGEKILTMRSVVVAKGQELVLVPSSVRTCLNFFLLSRKSI